MKLHNTIYCGDNLEWMRKIPDDTIDLIYADPPFFSNKDYEVIFDDGAEIRSFQDRWKGGIYHYIGWMKERCVEIQRILKPTGSFYLHCDWHAGHYLKVMLDEIFGMNNFQNEIIWFYKTGGASKKRFSRKHDTIYFYSKNDNYNFNLQKERSYMMHKYGFKKSDFAIDEKNGLQYSIVFLKDVWEIPSIGSATRERLGYPTQKPEKLLERIVKASSNEGDIVFDPFCGCGTTLAVAHKLNRQWIGIDVSPTACKLIKRRLENVKCSDVEIFGMPLSIKELHTLDPFEFQNWIVGSMGGTVNKRKTGDKGIDGWTYMNREPIQIKQSEHVGRKVVDEFVNALNRHYKTAKIASTERGEKSFIMKGKIVAFNFTKGVYEEIARLKREDNIDIEVLTVEEVLKEFQE
jgi:DNA modification methylase